MVRKRESVAEGGAVALPPCRRTAPRRRRGPKETVGIGTGKRGGMSARAGADTGSGLLMRFATFKQKGSCSRRTKCSRGSGGSRGCLGSTVLGCIPGALLHVGGVGDSFPFVSAGGAGAETNFFVPSPLLDGPWGSSF